MLWILWLAWSTYRHQVEPTSHNSHQWYAFSICNLNLGSEINIQAQKIDLILLNIVLFSTDINIHFKINFTTYILNFSTMVLMEQAEIESFHFNKPSSNFHKAPIYFCCVFSSNYQPQQRHIHVRLPHLCICLHDILISYLWGSIISLIVTFYNWTLNIYNNATEWMEITAFNNPHG